MQLILGLVLSAAIGLSLGLIGGGGSIITVPVLVYVIGVDAHQAVGMSLAVVGAASLIGAALHHRHGTVNVKTGALFGLSGTVGAYFGSGLTYLFSAAALLLSLGLAGHLSYGGFDLRVTGLVTALAAAGTLVGTALSHRVAPQKLRRGFAVFVIAVAAFLIAKNYSALL